MKSSAKMFYSNRTITVLTVLFAVLSAPLFSQDFGGRSREGRGFGGPPDGGRMGQMGGGPPGSPFGGGQPPWMNRGGERDGGRGGEGDRNNNERTLGMLRAMDTNGNGTLDPNEVPEYRKRFVDMMVSRLGGDPNKPVNLNNLARSASSSNNSGSSSGTPRSSGSTSSSSSKITGDPLVPAFGEKEEAKAPALEFGQREPVAKKTAVSTSAAAVSQTDQILRQAREIMNKYDKNKNGTLDKDKSEWISSLPFNADRSDKNRDGRVSMAELISALGGQSGASAGAAAVATKSSTPYDRIPPGMPDWFIERDKNQDAQLTMLEYANRQPMSEEIAKEFRFLDKNDDGTATVTEVFETLKQVDEEKRLKEELAQRERERRQGVGSATSAAVVTTTVATTAATPAGTPPPGTPQAPPAETPPPPEGGQPPAAPQPAVPAEPNWKPGTSPAAPTSAPSSAPYSGGSSTNERSSRSGSRDSRSDPRSDQRSSKYGRSR